jgi:hypothetical protein
MMAARPCLRLVHAVGTPLQQILQSIEGPVAKIIAVIIIITTGLTLAFGDTSAASAADPDRVRPVDRLRGQLLPVVLLVRRRGAGLMAGASIRAETCRASPSRSTGR